MKKAARRAPESTRRRLVEAAFAEIHEHGFQPTGLDAILARAGLTKGAVYHHFENKTELGHVVFDEVVVPWVHRRWIDPVSAADDPVGELIARVRAIPERTRRERALGCPLNNLILESPGLDEGFRRRMNALLATWRRRLAADLRRAQKAGAVRADVRPAETAAFLIAALEGLVGLAKPAGDLRSVRQGAAGCAGFLRSLRA